MLENASKADETPAVRFRLNPASKSVFLGTSPAHLSLPHPSASPERCLICGEHAGCAGGRVTVQNVSLALPVRRSHSCQPHPRWLRRGRLSGPERQTLQLHAHQDHPRSEPPPPLLLFLKWRGRHLILPVGICASSWRSRT